MTHTLLVGWLVGEKFVVDLRICNLAVFQSRDLAIASRRMLFSLVMMATFPCDDGTRVGRFQSSVSDAIVLGQTEGEFKGQAIIGVKKKK